LEPDVDIKIEFSGMRPGEKLFEELALAEENAERTRNPRVFIGRIRVHDWFEVNQRIAELVEIATDTDLEGIHDKFKEIVPEYLYEGRREKVASK
jgi:FlaA1/EpsC-like NDP-sugar epimerase